MRKKRNPPGLGGILGRLALAVTCVCLIAVFTSVQNHPPAPTPVLLSDPSPSLSPEPVSAKPPPTATLPPAPSPSPEFFTISMIGDCTLASNHGTKSSPASYESVVGDNYAYPFEKTVHFFADDDFTIANLECALTDYNVPDYKAFTFRAPPEYVNILKKGSVEFVSLGNNHVLDYGETGYNDTKAVLEENGIGYAGRDEWAIYTTASGLKIGVYALSFGETSQIKAGVKAVREAGAEFVIAAIHWGTEGFYTLNHLQEGQGRAAIDAGADLVMGTHPHTLQKVEEYNGKYIYYSLGNWSFGGNTNLRDRDTVIVKLNIMRDTDGSIHITGREHIPCAASGTKGGNNYQPVPYEEGSEEYERVLTKLEGKFTGPNLTVGYSYAAE